VRRPAVDVAVNTGGTKQNNASTTVPITVANTATRPASDRIHGARNQAARRAAAP
jgi:archaellin